MKKVLFVPTLVLAVSLQGCLASIPVNMLVAGGIASTARNEHADRCAAIETKAEKEKVSRIELKRRLTAADCSL